MWRSGWPPGSNGLEGVVKIIRNVCRWPNLDTWAQDVEWAERVGRMGAAAAGERPWPGCTAIVLLVHAGHLYVANAGDCRAVLCRQVCA